MKEKNIATLSASIILLLAGSLLSGCGDEVGKSKGDVVTKVSSENATGPVYDIGFSAELVDDDSDITEIKNIADMLQDASGEITESFDIAMELADETVGDLMGIAEPGIETSQDLIGEAGAAISATIDKAKQIITDGADIVPVTPEIIRDIQRSLVNAGFNPGSADGISGPRTLAALASFQEQNNLATGQVTKETLRVLGVSF